MVTEVIKGVLYRVKTFKGLKEIELLFTHRDGNGQPVDGLTNEALIEVVLKRLRHMNNVKPCGENVVFIRLLERCLESSKNRLINKKTKDGKFKGRDNKNTSSKT